MLQRTFPYGTADRDAHLQAIASAKAMNRRLKKSASRQAEWEFVGPTNIGGRISDLEYDPINPQTIYAGAATGGVFKSTDGGETWQPVFDDQAVLPIGDIAIDSKNPEIVYVGTGEANGGHNNFPGGGVFKSTDGGANWQHIGLTETTTISRILVDPVDSKRIYVASIGGYFGPDEHRGIFRSLDSGVTWAKILFIN
ncbi:MAG: WD40/YVTN/BNR-like repeat-containing protein, partial [bacterium]